MNNNFNGDYLTPTDFLAFLNQTIEYAYSSVTIVGEVSEFKVNQGKWVFFNIKDDETSVPCFMTLWSLKTPLEDGMKVIIRGVPKVTKWGKLSVTVSKYSPVGEGSLKKAFEILKKKLADEGLFDPAKKRSIPEDLTKIGVISSTQAAGYADFIKIINARWGGIKVYVAHTQVQGLDAPEQMVRALKYFNERGDVEVIALIRGGGSKDDLACFNDEELVRAIAASRIPVITGIGHEIDETLSDLAADKRGSTPSNVAELLTKDRKSEKILEKVERIRDKINAEIRMLSSELAQKKRMIETLNPENVLKQGYAIIGGELKEGSVVKITTFDWDAEAKINKINERKK
ncbi:exodeoxyribonuclease VII large subunit [Candidatus Saccharibacteria bacterium]|nr:exodeoxyribonuclease VII large subunit [Candidatus Saccharibacteria bacterium]